MVKNPLSLRAFTMIELLVAIAVISLLVAFLIPAVQAAREASRRVGCLNNLRQIGIGLHSYLDASGSLPNGSAGSQSIFISLLPHIEQSNLYNSLNLSYWPTNETDPAQVTSVRASIATLLCPSDPLGQGARTNYAGCMGATLGDGIFLANIQTSPRGLHVSPPMVTDGLTTTCAIAEWLITSPIGETDRRRALFQPFGEISGTMTNLDQFTQRCNALMDETPVNSRKGLSWLEGVPGTTLFNTAMPINAPSCLNVSGGTPLFAYTAGSQHPGGGNVLFVDGHTVFVKDSVSLPVWRAIGTRAGGEVISSLD